MIDLNQYRQNGEASKSKANQNKVQGQEVAKDSLYKRICVK